MIKMPNSNLSEEKNIFAKNAITLVELMVAITLLSLIFLTSANIDIASRKLTNAAERQAELQNEISPALLQIKKSINLATGEKNNSGLNIDAANNRIAIRLDIDANGIPNIGTANDYTDDNWIAYQLVENKIQYYLPYGSSGGFPVIEAPNEIISTRVEAFTLTSINSAFDAALSRGAEISITARFMPGQRITTTNPELTLATSAHAISQSAR